MTIKTYRKAIQAVAGGMVTLLTACSPEKPAEAHLVLLYTTDIHGACLPYDFNRNEPAQTSLANVSSYLRQEREKHPDAVMLFDTGDILQGQPSMYYYNFVDTTSRHVVADVYNYMGYDAIGVGNHDIECGEAIYYDRLPQQLEMPWICANAIDTRTNKPMFTPYAIVQRQGIKVAVLGMITPNIHAWLPKALWANLEFQDMVECAAQWIPYIQKEEKPDLIVGLFHSGSDYMVNGNTLDTYKNENGGIPAAIKVPGFDLILLGHDHQQGLKEVVNVAGDTVRVMDAFTQAAFVGRADITLKRVGNKYQKKIETSLVPMREMPVDTLFAETFADRVEAVNRYVDQPLGTLTSTLRAFPALFGPSDFMDFIHEVQLWATGADISFASLLSSHAVVDAGPLTMRQLFSLYKYENLMYKMQMSGDEVRRYLEHGYSLQFNEMRSVQDHLLAFKSDEKGNLLKGAQLLTPTFNFTSAAGIRYTVDVSKPVGDRVTIHEMSDGKPFVPNATYVVAINSYQASGGGGFLPVGLKWDEKMIASRTLTTTTKDVRGYVADYIRQVKTIVPRQRGDWKVVPELWWKAGKERDARLINYSIR